MALSLSNQQSTRYFVCCCIVAHKVAERLFICFVVRVELTRGLKFRPWISVAERLFICVVLKVEFTSGTWAAFIAALESSSAESGAKLGPGY